MRRLNSRGSATWLWLFGALALAVFPALALVSRPLQEQLRVPATPLDRTDWQEALGWDFLEHCGPLLPRGATFTVLAADAEMEMNLFMMSIGALPANTALPSSYYGVPVDEGARADYVLAFQRSAPAGKPLEVVARFGNGVIYRRVARP